MFFRRELQLKKTPICNHSLYKTVNLDQLATWNPGKYDFSSFRSSKRGTTGSRRTTWPRITGVRLSMVVRGRRTVTGYGSIKISSRCRQTLPQRETGRLLYRPVWSKILADFCTTSVRSCHLTKGAVSSNLTKRCAA